MKPIVIFDGYCNLCNSFIDFLLKRKRTNKLIYITLQSEAGIGLLKKSGISEDIDSVVFVEGETFYIRSDAVLKIIHYLPLSWKVFLVFYVLPRKLRDRIYRFIASRRYRIWGKRESCRVL